MYKSERRCWAQAHLEMQRELQLVRFDLGCCLQSHLLAIDNFSRYAPLSPGMEMFQGAIHCVASRLVLMRVDELKAVNEQELEISLMKISI